MKVIAFYPGVYPEGFAPMSYRLHYYMKALQMQGVDVEIVVPSDNGNKEGIYDNVPYRHITTVKRTRFNSSVIVNEYVKICDNISRQCDVLFTTFKNKKLADVVHFNGCKIVIEINENPFSNKASITDTSIILWVKRYWFLKKTIKSFDGIITISHSLFGLVLNYKNCNTEVIRIPILTGVKEIDRKEVSGIPYILHAGALNEHKDGIKAMLKAFAIAHKELNGNLKFIFTNKIGFSALLNWIDRFIIRNNLQNEIEFKGIVPKKELDLLFDGCVMAILNKPVNIQNNYNFPTKLTELLPRNIPIIISRTGEINHYFTDNVNAYMIEPNNPEQIAEKIIRIINSPQEANRIALNGKKLANDLFYYERHSTDLYNFFKIVSKKA